MKVAAWVYADGHGNTATVKPLDESFELRVLDHGSLVWHGLYGSRHAAASALRRMYTDMHEAGREVGFYDSLQGLIASGMSAVEASREMGIDNYG